MSGRLLKRIGVTVEAASPVGLGLESTPHRDAIVRWCEEHTVAEICEAMAEIDIPAAPVLTIPEVTRDPHLWEREMLTKVTDRHGRESYVPGVTIKLSRTPGQVGPVPEAGEHTDELLAALLGYGSEKIRALHEAQIVSGPGDAG
jgi:crotonobetainyl-CoA:carnitine CoA-transferase CaiB-like acyl-CoA transferase